MIWNTWPLLVPRSQMTLAFAAEAFAAHTLKGSAAAVGALKLQNLAACLELLAFPGEPDVRLLRLQGLKAAAAEFREAARSAYPMAQPG